MLNIGDERNVAGNFVSGALASGIVTGSMNYNRYKKADIGQAEFLSETIKISLQGGVGSAAAIATTNYVGKGNYLAAVKAFSLGAMGVYAIEKIYENINLYEVGEQTDATK